MKKKLHKIAIKHKDNLKGLFSLILLSILGLIIFSFLGDFSLDKPHKAELSFTEYSFNDKSKGSVIPASCNAAPADTHSGTYNCSCPTGQHQTSSSETGVSCDWDIVTLNCDYGTLSWKYNEPAKSCVTCSKLKSAGYTSPGGSCYWSFFGRCMSFDPIVIPASYYTAASQAQCPNTAPQIFVR